MRMRANSVLKQTCTLKLPLATPGIEQARSRANSVCSYVTTQTAMTKQTKWGPLEPIAPEKPLVQDWTTEINYTDKLNEL